MFIRSGIACSTDAVPIKINLIAPPLYVITTSTPEKQDGIQILNDACKAIEDRISASGGSFNIQMAPKVVTATDEQDLAKQLERAEQENAEVSFSFIYFDHTKTLNRCFYRFPVMTMMRMKNRLEWEERYQREKRVTKKRKIKKCSWSGTNTYND